MHFRKLLLILVAVVTLVPTSLRAQYPFGKNKVVYQSRDWKVLKTEHVDIYHYASDSGLIRYVAPLVEETFREFTETFKVEFDGRLPFVLYASHYDFQQTNILPYLISEYTGGFTDLMKGRIAVPFTGSYSMFRHVVRHEMVHAFMLEKLKHVAKDHGKHSFNHPPLWFVEGMAEYFATAPQGRRGNMFVRDALINGNLYDLQDIWRIQGSFMMYKQGEAAINYIASSFGPEAVIQILENWWTADRFPLVLKNTINMDLKEFNESFMHSLKRRYFPSLLSARFASEIGTQLTPERSFHSRCAARMDSSGGLAVYSLCAEDGVINVCELTWDERGRRHHRTMVKGGRTSDLESLPAFRSKIEVRGDTLVFVSKSKDRDIIYFWSIEKGKSLAAYSFDGLSLLYSPTLSGDGSKMVFSAIDSSGTMDLYRYFLKEERLERLTNDGFGEDDPDYNPVREEILFTSDRGAGERTGRTHIYRMDLNTHKVVAIEGGDHADSNPEWASDGKSFLFVSDREGTSNIYHNKGNLVVRQTRAVGGITYPSFLPDGTGFIANVYEKGAFNLYKFPIRNGTGRSLRLSPADTTITPWTMHEFDDEEWVTQNYHTRFSIDFVGVGVSVDPEFGEVGNGGSLYLTDVLGNHQIQTFFGSTTEDFDNFWEHVNAGFTWVNQSRRFAYSLSLFRLNSLNAHEFITAQREKRVGGALGLSYGLNKFRRIEGQLVLRHVDRSTEVYYTELEGDKSFTSSLFLTYVDDNVLWTIGGPATGRRYYVTGGQTVDFLNRGFTSTNLFADYRRYFKIARRTVIAMRYQVRSKFGGDRDRVFYLGGPWSLRGYKYREFFGRTTQLLNSEIRFPAIDGFKLVLPFGVIELPPFRGALFFDVGSTAGNGEASAFNSGWLGSFGVGVELNLGYAPVVRVNFTQKTDFDSISPDTGVELFIGYNY